MTTDTNDAADPTKEAYMTDDSGLLAVDDDRGRVIEHGIGHEKEVYPDDDGILRDDEGRAIGGGYPVVAFADDA